jgi:hypothetical protein
MKRRGFLAKSLGGVVASGLTLVQGQEEAVTSNGLMRTPVNLMAPRPDGITLVWAVNGLCRGWVEWKGEGAEGKADMTPAGFVPQTDEVFQVDVNGLKPGGEYEVRAVVIDVETEKREESAWKKFRTIDPKAAMTKFLIWNDTHENNATIQKLDDASPKADFFLWNGDTCNDWKEEAKLIPTLLHPGGRDITNGRPMLLNWGNHDGRGKFAYKVPSCIGMTDGRPFTAFRSGPVAAIFLHTGEDKPDDHPSFKGRVSFDKLRKEQAEWLKEVIERPEFKNAPYRVAFCHIPLRWLEEPETVDYAGKGFDHYSRRSRDLWHNSLVKWKTQLVVSGHTHNSQWIPANDQFPYGQLVGGGPQLERARWIVGEADEKSLRFTVTDLTGAVTHEVKFEPVA